ncbi:carboxymuconolactone decarboxylase family protein [Peribacillus sp. NPDC097895]|uniref:carboxymuconolactone decarboxylase family protein n=1 Tax=Peribacillus sp. NPDC097895 TaxID=3390619 RepID=UPI003D03D5D2
MHLLSYGRLLTCRVTIDVIMETLKIGVSGGCSITYPNSRFAMHALEVFTAGSALSQVEKLKE